MQYVRPLPSGLYHNEAYRLTLSLWGNREFPDGRSDASGAPATGGA